MTALVDKFLEDRQQSDVSTDQLLNSIFLTVAMRNRDTRTFSNDELTAVRSALARPLSGATA
jgi:hypothetical protein